MRDKAVQTWQGMIFKIWKNSADRQFERAAAVSGSYQVAPSASTDGQFGQFGGKKGRSHNNWCRFWEMAKKPPCGNYCPFASASGNHWTGRSCQRYILVTFYPKYQYLGTIWSPENVKIYPPIVWSKKIYLILAGQSPLRCKEMLFSNFEPFWSSLTSNDMNFHRPFTIIRHGCQVWSPSDCNNCNIVVPAVTSQVMKGVALSRVAIWNRGGALLPIALCCSALWWQLTLEETWLQLGDEGGEGGCLPSNQTSLVALHWVAIDCIGVSQLHCRMFPLALGLQWQGKCQRGEAKLQTRLPLRQILSGDPEPLGQW